jgi:WD40 repeat protein
VNRRFAAASNGERRFQALLKAFEAHHHRSALKSEPMVAASGGDDFRISPDPYPGLRSFTPQEGGVFFGRERNVNEVRERLSALNFAVVLGGSGSGKSSLVRAGLIPRLNSTKAISGRNGNWYAAEFRPRLQPINEIAKALEEIVTEHFSNESDNSKNEQAADVIRGLRSAFRSELNGAVQADRSSRAETLSTALLDFVDSSIDQLDRAASHGLRSGKPSLLLIVDQFEEVFRPEVVADPLAGAGTLLDTLIATCAKLTHMRRAGEQSGLFIVITMRSEELHRCAEHPALAIASGEGSVTRSLADIINHGMYLLDLLDPVFDRDDLREAIVRPARRVFYDWGLPLDANNPDAPYATGVVDWLLSGAERLSRELEHRPDQLPLLQHALQAIWRGTLEGWEATKSPAGYEIRKEDLHCPLHEDGLAPDLAACLDKRADLTAAQGVNQFAEAQRSHEWTLPSHGKDDQIGKAIIRGAFRALAQRDDRGNWARRFADQSLIKAFLVGDSQLHDFTSKQCAQGIYIALSPFVAQGYLLLRDEYYDISHEALIRNWKQYQEWLRDPQEISRALVRAVGDLDPGRLSGDTPEVSDDLLSNLSPSLCDTLEKVLEKHELPQKWVTEQILPLVNKPDVAKRWGTANPAKIVEVLRDLVSRAQLIRRERVLARSRKVRNFWLAIGGAVMLVLAGAVGFTTWRGHEATKNALITRAKMVALSAEQTLNHEGPARSLLIALEAQKAGLPDIAETEQVIYRSLRDLREQRDFPLGKVSGATISPNGDVIVGLTSDGILHFWRTSDGVTVGSHTLSIAGSAQTFGVQWSPDGSRLAVGEGNAIAIVAPCSNPKLKVLFSSCAEREKDLDIVLGNATEPAAIGKFSSDGKRLVTGMWRAPARIWNIDDGTNFSLGAETATPWAIALAPNMKVAAAGAGDGSIHLVDPTTRETRILRIPDKNNVGAVTSLAFGKEDHLLLASTQNGQVWLWDLNTGKGERLKDQHQGQIFQAAFSGDGSYVAAAGGDGALRLWSVQAISNPPFVLRGHTGLVTSVQFALDGSHLVSASPDDGTIRYWSPVSALHSSIGKASNPISPTILHGSSAQDADAIGKNDEVRKTNEQGYTVVAYNGAKKHLALFGPDSSKTPLTEWGNRIDVTWRSVAFERQNASGNGSGPDTIVAISSDGQTFSWPYFQSLDLLTKFAQDKVPFYGDVKLTLSSGQLCKLGLAPKLQCPGDGEEN